MRCNDCINYKSCKLFGENIFGNQYEYNVEEMCHYFKDKSLFVELPCKVGSVVYTTNCSKVVPRVVKEICYNNKGITYIAILANNKESKYWFSITTIGKTVFLTKEDAEQKSKELECK